MVFYGATSVAVVLMRRMTACTSFGCSLNRLRLNTSSYSVRVGADTKTSQNGERATWKISRCKPSGLSTADKTTFVSSTSLGFSIRVPLLSPVGCDFLSDLAQGEFVRAAPLR